jgi:ABC-type nitrate/sulfonate/bicarbonate transport system substrate-binding protein
MTEIVLGFAPLADCAALAVAAAKGFFRAERLDVRLSREPSWAALRDRLAAGELHGGHMVGPMALALSLGVDGPRLPVIAPLVLNLNGGAVTLSRPLAEALRRLDPDGMAARTARPLARLIAARRELGSAPLTFAVVFPFSMQAYELRYWLAEAGIDPDTDVRIVAAPPAGLADQLRAGLIDGFCVGAPWGAAAVADGAGQTVAYAGDIWHDRPDKVLGLAAAWAEAEPEAVQALLRALIRAADWADRPENRAELAEILAHDAYVGVSADLIARSLEETEVAFHRRGAGFPWTSQAAWFLSQMRRWGQIGPEVDVHATARQVWRPDLFRTAAAAGGKAAPAEDWKPEQGLEAPYDAEAYARGFAITRA